MNIRDSYLRAAAGPALQAAGGRPLAVGQLVQWALLEASDAEREQGVASTPVFGVLLGRDPRDSGRWLVAPADALPVAGDDDVWIGAAAQPTESGGLWIRLSCAFLLSDPVLRRLPAAGEIASAQLDRLVVGVMSRVQGEAPSDWGTVLGEVEAGVAWSVTHEDLVGCIESALPAGVEHGEALWHAIAECIARGGGKATPWAAGGAVAPTPLRFAAAVEPTPRREWSCSWPDGRRVVVRRTGNPSQLIVLLDLADDVVEVRVNGRRAVPSSHGYSAEVDLAADEGMVSLGVTTGIGITLTACIDTSA